MKHTPGTRHSRKKESLEAKRMNNNALIIAVERRNYSKSFCVNRAPIYHKYPVFVIILGTSASFSLRVANANFPNYLKHTFSPFLSGLAYRNPH